MATPIKEIFKDKKYPKWFSSHPIFKEVKTIKKVFPSIGLPNCIEDANVDNIDQAKQSAGILIGDINAIISYSITLLNRHKKTIKNKVNKEKTENCSTLLQAVFNQLKKSNDIIQVNNGRVSLKLSDNITIEGDNRPVFRKNESLFRVYNKLSEMLQEANVAGLDPLENAYSFKAFSTDNIPNNGFKIVFSSDGAEGAWDIGTMSMRGISSCQSWDRGEYKYCTIGSVIDPFVGIIYMTTNGKFNEYGSKMVRRCVVRFVIDGKNHKPYILIDRMYPSGDNKVIAQFKKFIETKTNNKFDVFYAENMDYKLLQESYLPLNPIRKKLKDTSREGKSRPYDEYESIQSYQDCKIKNQSGNKKDKQAVLFDKNSRKKENKFIKIFSKAFVDAIKKIDIEKVPRTIKPAMKLLILPNKNRYYSYDHTLNAIGSSLAKQIIDNVDKTQFTNSDTYIRRVYYSFFNHRNKAIHSSKNELIKKLNGELYLKAGHRFGIRNFVPLMQSVFPLMEKEIKEELKKVVDKRNEMKIEPLPLP
jgi:hypothetical protein